MNGLLRLVVGFWFAQAGSLYAIGSIPVIVDALIEDFETGAPLPGAVLILLHHGEAVANKNGKAEVRADNAAPNTKVTICATDHGFVNQCITVGPGPEMHYRFRLKPLTSLPKKKKVSQLEGADQGTVVHTTTNQTAASFYPVSTLFSNLHSQLYKQELTTEELHDYELGMTASQRTLAEVARAFLEEGAFRLPSKTQNLYSLFLSRRPTREEVAWVRTEGIDPLELAVHLVTSEEYVSKLRLNRRRP